MKYGALFGVVAALLVAFTLQRGGWAWICIWPAVSAAVIATGYLGAGPRVFDKSHEGILSFWNQLLLFPYLVVLACVWHITRITRRGPAYHQLTDNVFIGRRLINSELPDDFEHIIDLTCEFNEPRSVRLRSYTCFPILDAHVPPLGRLREWATYTTNLDKVVYIHCAEGFGRTRMLAVMVIRSGGEAQSLEEAIKAARGKRPGIRFNKTQMAALKAAAEEFEST